MINGAKKLTNNVMYKTCIEVAASEEINWPNYPPKYDEIQDERFLIDVMIRLIMKFQKRGHELIVSKYWGVRSKNRTWTLQDPKGRSQATGYFLGLRSTQRQQTYCYLSVLVGDTLMWIIRIIPFLQQYGSFKKQSIE